MRGLLIFAAALFGALFMIEIVAACGAWWLHGQGRYDDEIAWFEEMKPMLVLDLGLEGRIAGLYRGRIRRELMEGHLDRAARALRLARARARSLGTSPDTELIALGIETFTRAADRLEAHGRISLAADWDDSLFVLAVRAPEPRHRYAALAAFMEGLDLRARDGKPCAALARIAWAKRGLGGQVPGLQSNVEEDLSLQCHLSRRTGRER